MPRFVEFELTGEMHLRRDINPDHVESVQSADYDGVHACHLKMKSGEDIYVVGDRATVLRKLGR